MASRIHGIDKSNGACDAEDKDEVELGQPSEDQQLGILTLCLTQ
jgi:hypothetical protein